MPATEPHPSDVGEDELLVKLFVPIAPWILHLLLFLNERQRLIHDAVRQVHARLAKPLQNRTCLGEPASPLCCENETKSAPYGNSQGGGTAPAGQIVDNCLRPWMCVRPCENSPTFPKVPGLDDPGDRQIIDSHYHAVFWRA